MQTQKEKEIDGIKFVVTAFRAVEALRLKAYLMKKFGPAMGQAVGTFGSGLLDNSKIGGMKVDGNKIAQTIEQLMVELGEDEYIAFIKRMFRNVVAHVNNKQFVFIESQFESSMDIVFGGRTFTIYPVLLLVLEANYPDFFGKVVRDIGERIRRMETFEPPEENSMNEPEELGM